MAKEMTALDIAARLHSVVVSMEGRRGSGTRVSLDGFEIKGLKDVTVHQSVLEHPTITIELIVASVNKVEAD